MLLTPRVRPHVGGNLSLRHKTTKLPQNLCASLSVARVASVPPGPVGHTSVCRARRVTLQSAGPDGSDLSLQLQVSACSLSTTKVGRAVQTEAALDPSHVSWGQRLGRDVIRDLAAFHRRPEPPRGGGTRAQRRRRVGPTRKEVWSRAGRSAARSEHVLVTESRRCCDGWPRLLGEVLVGRQSGKILAQEDLAVGSGTLTVDVVAPQVVVRLQQLRTRLEAGRRHGATGPRTCLADR